MEPGVIHVARNDNKFKARMRFHQSWYRRYKLGLSPGPNLYAKDPSELFGSRLTSRDGAAGKNFLTAEIFRVAQERLGKGCGFANEKDRSRLMYDLLSSQPMCFNLFGPLARDLDLATRLVRTLPGLPADIEVTNVALEYAPKEHLHLGDATSHDAFVEYGRADGERGFVGIETKLTEPFSATSYPFNERYSRWMKVPGWWWSKGSETQFPDREFNQLWRNHLLAFAMLKQDPPTYSEAFAAVLYHDDDTSCLKAMRSYRSHLRPEAQDTLLDWPLSMVLEAWPDALETPDERSWFADFRLRYWDLDASQPAWDEFNERRIGAKR